MGFLPFPVAHLYRLALIGFAAACLGACTESDIPKAERPVPYALTSAMEQKDMEATSPIFIRLYKESSEFEIWKQKRNGDYALLKTYQICKWSGALGPKKVEGDRQAPEGIYIVGPAQMNPASHYYLSFNIGYPNSYDRSLGRTGSNLMVHGACSSAGCYSMTDEDAGEIFSLARDSFRGGQRSFQIQALPFRMTAENLAKHKDDPNMPFWRMLKVGSDNFDLTLRPPKVDVCDHQYVFNADAGGASFDPSAKCPPYTVPQQLVDALTKKQAADDIAFNQAVTTLQGQEKEAADKAADVAAKEQAKVAAQAERDAAQAQREADKAAAAAERDTQPSLVQRILSKFRKAPREDATGTTADLPKPQAMVAPASVSATAPAEKVLASAPPPEPRLRPASTATTVSAPADTTGSITPAGAPEEAPAVGKFVKKKFVWPGDGDDTTTGAGTDTSG